MALFKARSIKKTTGDPFLDSVVSLTSDNQSDFTSIRALRNSDVFTAIKVIASDIASSELQLIKSGLVEEEAKLSYLINVKPNQLMDGWHFKFALAANMLLNGNSFAEIIRNGEEVAELRLLLNSEVSLIQNENGTLTYEKKEGTASIKLAAHDVLHFKYFSQDGIVGLSPLHSLKDELNVQEAGNNTLYNFFSKGVNGSGILTVHKSDLDGKAKEAIRKKFEEANGSNDGENSLRTIILDETMDYKTLEINTEVLKLVNSNDWTTKQIAKVFGISTDRLGVEQQHSSNVQANLMYLQNTLIHFFSVFTTEIRSKLLDDKKLSVRFNADRLLETDPQSVLETTIKAVQGSLLTINEGRKKIGLPKADGGDRLLVSLNYTHLDNLDTYQFRKENTVDE
ncbi:phage portal protein [Vagococcus salmoninarum]|uniref:Phage portal protein n=1 Tax=Vagococcus salmoninarum TaxID=2739 RepID=A0A429ZVT4_9ENTE|nr:phage portal protein [Vagococcus salmoninarum]RST97746.1 phage portal protein [Vagococcus salmoninarum]RST98007.1 phage portal protein [Vagococcus salmoninarum]